MNVTNWTAAGLALAVLFLTASRPKRSKFSGVAAFTARIIPAEQPVANATIHINIPRRIEAFRSGRACASPTRNPIAASLSSSTTGAVHKGTGSRSIARSRKGAAHDGPGIDESNRSRRIGTSGFYVFHRLNPLGQLPGAGQILSYSHSAILGSSPPSISRISYAREAPGTPRHPDR